MKKRTNLQRKVAKTQSKETDKERGGKGKGTAASGRAFEPKEVTGKQWFWFLLFLGLAMRLIPMGYVTAETTDGVLCLTYFSPDRVPTPRFILMPGYPALLWLAERIGIDGALAGRLISSAAGLLFLLPLWKLARRWLSTEISGIVCLMALFSPLLWQWSPKVMPDNLFLLLFTWTLERLVAVSTDRDGRAWAAACVLGVLATTVRPEGIFLLPWILLAARSVGSMSWIPRIACLALWLLPAWLLREKFHFLVMAYREGLGMTLGPSRVKFPFLNFIEHLYAYFAQPFYIFTPMVFGAALLGLAKMVRLQDAKAVAFKRVLLQVFALLLISRLFPTQYQDRHMLPFTALVLLAAGYQLESFFGSLDRTLRPVRWHFLRNLTLVGVLTWMALYSSATVLAQRDSFGDIRRSSEFLAGLPADAKIYSDEVPKTQFWSGKKVELMHHLVENTTFKPKPGDYVVLHSFYSPRLRHMEQTMRDKFGVVQLHSSRSMVVPLLTDIMEDPKLQNRLKATAYRFEPQFFTSKVYRTTR